MSALVNLADNSNVYEVAKESALSIAPQLSKRFNNNIYLKREDDQVSTLLSCAVPIKK